MRTQRRAPCPEPAARRSAWRLGLAAAALGAAVATAAAGASDARSTAPAKVYFYGNIGEPINGTAVKNPLLVRPSTLLLTEDGSWVITKLHWSGWGSSVARATGVSSASSCKPSCAAGKRITSPAQFTLSSPGRFQGHEVYRCFQLTVPSSPKANQLDCLGRVGSLTLYVSQTVPNSSPTKTVWIGFNFQSPSGNILCDQGDEDMVDCTSFSLPHTASLSTDGTVRICTGRSCLGASSNTKAGAGVPVLAYGQQNQRTKNGFLCVSEQTGITCTVASPGKAYRLGFLITRDGVSRVGP